MDSDRQRKLGDLYLNRHRSAHRSVNTYFAHHPVPYFSTLASKTNNNDVVLFAAGSSSYLHYHHRHLERQSQKLISPEEKKLQQRLKRQEKQRLISEKMRALQKLLPCDKKMDMGTVLEETHKYIMFLRAQIAVLRSMPVRRGLMPNPWIRKSNLNTCIFGANENNDDSLMLSGDAQQLLQMLLNANVVQSMLCSNGSCLYTVEQLVYLLDNAAVASSSSDAAAAYDHHHVNYPQLS